MSAPVDVLAVKLPKQYVTRDGAACSQEGRCTRCGKRLHPSEAVGLELDQRVDEYHDLAVVPVDQSQGIFYFGADCAEKSRIRARAALARIGGAA